MMRSRRDHPAAGEGARHRRRGRPEHPGGDVAADGRPCDGDATPGNAGREAPGGGQQPEPGFGEITVEDVKRTATGWRVGDEEVSDLTSAMVLADLLAADLPGTPPPPAGAQPREPAAPEPDVRQLQETVAQLEHALTVRVRVEQAIGVLAERHRLRPRQAFELLRSAARARGRRVLELAGEVVESATNPLLRIPEELARPAVPRRGRLGRRGRG
jgi:hypothetical protein